jgi:hypothetical protein
MANDEHVALLKQGVAAWNKWRDENANIRPNLNEGEPPRREPQRRESERGGPDTGEPERTAESGLRHRLNLSLRGPRNDDPSRERSINVTLRETEIFRPSKAGAARGAPDASIQNESNCLLITQGFSPLGVPNRRSQWGIEKQMLFRSECPQFVYPFLTSHLLGNSGWPSA